MITLNKRFKTPVRKIFPRLIVCRRLRTQGRCRKLLLLCWPLHQVKVNTLCLFLPTLIMTLSGSFLRIYIYILRQPCSLRKAPFSNVLDDRISWYNLNTNNSYESVFWELCWGNIIRSKVTFRDPIVFAAVEIHNMFLLCLR